MSKKEQGAHGEWGHMEVEQHFPGTGFVLASGYKHDTVQQECRNEIEKRASTKD